MLNAILKFFNDKFPDFKGNEIYLSGESYAGIYVPYLLDKIDQHNKDNKDDTIVFKPNLKGMAVINGATNYEYDVYPSMLETAYSHFLIDDDFYNAFKALDCPFNAGPIGSFEFKRHPKYFKCI